MIREKSSECRRCGADKDFDTFAGDGRKLHRRLKHRSEEQEELIFNHSRTCESTDEAHPSDVRCGDTLVLEKKGSVCIWSLKSYSLSSASP